MTLRLRPRLSSSALAELIRTMRCGEAIRELDLTNCILLEPEVLPPHIGRCRRLQSLRCVACPLRPSDLLGLMLERLPHLAEVEFSLVADTDVESEIRQLQQRASEMPDARALNLRRMYAEVSGHRNFKLLSALLRFCPKIDELRVHFVRGTFLNALLECNVIFQQCASLQTFAFSSEVPPSFQQLPPEPLEFTSYAAVCANVTYRRSSNMWNCVLLRDLVDRCGDPLLLPQQLVLVAVLHAEGPTVEWIRLASLEHFWTNVCKLCLLLFPAQPSDGVYATAGAAYSDSLRDLISTKLRQVVELNISAFHFGPDLDLTALLQDGSLEHLQSLSATPCGLRRPSALRRLALNCPDFKELDVRFDRRGSFVRCAICEAGSVRLSDCPSHSLTDYPSLGQLLARNSSLSCLVLRHDALPFGEACLLENISRIASLQYLCLLSAVTSLDNVAEVSVLAFSDRLKPRIKCVHVHYRSSTDGIEKRITWVKQAGAPTGGVLVRDGPCFIYCSTATFIGLAKPLNRDFEEIL
ncbi:uncharacterized protein [Dermacentor albipictus]|uniref:uncharacterized protein n=1 Tax=Dermacentor albipictus TaxID=60249 RepID=UPI0038FBFFF6